MSKNLVPQLCADPVKVLSLLDRKAGVIDFSAMAPADEDLGSGYRVRPLMGAKAERFAMRAFDPDSDVCDPDFGVDIRPGKKRHVCDTADGGEYDQEVLCFTRLDDGRFVFSLYGPYDLLAVDVESEQEGGSGTKEFLDGALAKFLKRSR